MLALQLHPGGVDKTRISDTSNVIKDQLSFDFYLHVLPRSGNFISQHTFFRERAVLVIANFLVWQYYGVFANVPIF